MKNVDEGPWLTAEEVAAKLQLHRNSVYEAIRLNKLRHARIGRRIRVRESWVDDLLKTSPAAAA